MFWRVYNEEVAITMIAHTKDYAFANAIKLLGDIFSKVEEVEDKKYNLELMDETKKNRYIIGIYVSNNSPVFLVDADDYAEALDILVDFISENEIFSICYSDYYELADIMDSEYETVEDYADANGMVCCGNKGLYIIPTLISEIAK